MKKKNKSFPEFKSEEEERAFWAQNDSVGLIDWESAQQATFPALKPSLKSISIRLPESMIDQLKVMANKRDVPYQSLVKTFLSQKISEELSVGAS
ncbi:MAG: BrnA antitoxin family protein [Verrucomicrobia bacterium]|nr:BrnA antitoxin family protein [Verrucomicrobiota bacterium]